MNEAIEKGYRLRFAEYSQFEFRNTSGSAKDLEGVQLEQVNLLREAGKSGDLSLIVSVEKTFVETELAYYSNSKLMEGSLKTTLKELAVVERHIGIVDDPVRYKAIDEAHSLPRNRKGDSARTPRLRTAPYCSRTFSKGECARRRTFSMLSATSHRCSAM